MTTRATALAVETAYDVWAKTVRSKGGHIAGLRLTHEDNIWRVVGADDTTPIPCGDSTGFLGMSNREALTALRRSTSQLAMVPNSTHQTYISEWMERFNESEIPACREQAREHLTRLALGQRTMMRLIHVPVNEGIIEHEDELYTLTTDLLDILVRKHELALTDATLRHTVTGEEITVSACRASLVRVLREPAPTSQG